MFVCGAQVAAQTATLIGTVVRDSANVRLSGAEVSIAALGRSAVTNDLGEFRMNDLAPGRHFVLIRHVGYAAKTDTVELTAGATLERAFVLTPSVAQLDSVRVLARERKYISPALNAFEERRKMGFGYFLTDSLLRLHDSDRLSSVMRRIPGVNLVPYSAGMYAGTLRSSGNTGAVHVIPGDRRSPVACWSTVYLDGVVLYTVALGRRGADAPDYNSFNVDQLGAVEYYAGSAGIPAQYASTEYGCGTLLLWTRER
jgi:CarboxypepD_reg-like domain